MDRKTILITALIFLMLSISAVSAEDINQTESSLEISDSEIISDEPTTGSFTDLSQAVSDNKEELNDKYGFLVRKKEKFSKPTKGEPKIPSTTLYLVNAMYIPPMGR